MEKQFIEAVDALELAFKEYVNSGFSGPAWARLSACRKALRALVEAAKPAP